MSSHPYLFVYGTLKSAFRNRYALRLQREAILLGRARIQGRLYLIRRYPGLRPSRDPDDLVTGELYRLRQPLATLKVLDEYEGKPYRRVLVKAVLESGESIRAWVYTYQLRRPEDRHIASGEWP